MKKISTIISIILAAKLLISCSEQTQTVEWYIEHHKVLAKEIEKCKLKTLTELVKDKHCMIIRQAQQRTFYDHQINAPLPNIEFK